MSPINEEILVLYGSQRGTSQQAAEDFHRQISEKLSSDSFKRLTGNTRNVSGCSSSSFAGPVELDDFLENPKWTRLVVIFVSSYGTGEAPFGAHNFRRLCEAWIKTFKGRPAKEKPLRGIHFAICGLGDSFYEKTFMMNPKTICDGLTLAGAEMVGDRGVCDALEGREKQQKAIEEWVDGIWLHLATVLTKEPLSRERLPAIVSATVVP